MSGLNAEISIKDIHASVIKMEGQLVFLLNLVNQVNDNKEQIIKLQKDDEILRLELENHKKAMQHIESSNDRFQTEMKAEQLQIKAGLDEVGKKVLVIVTAGGIVIGALNLFSEKILNLFFS